jgi:hypothetical protein
MTFTAVTLPCEPYMRTVPGSMFAYDIGTPNRNSWLVPVYCIINNLMPVSNDHNYTICKHIGVICQAGRKCWCWWSNDRAIYDLRPDILEACQLWADNHFEMPLWRFLNATLEDTP